MMSSANHYLRTLSRIVLTLLGSIALFNWAVDPYALYNTPQISGFNKHKTDVYKYTRISQAYNSWEQAPEHILLGSSRSYFGFADEVQLPNGRKLFNLALPAGNFYEAYRYFLHANQRQPLKSILIGADMFMFNRHFAINETFSDKRLATDAQGRKNSSFQLTRLREHFNSLLTGDALQTAVRTVNKQRLVEKYQLQADEGRAVSLARDVRKHGTRTAFLRIQGSYPAKWCPPPVGTFSLGDTQQPESPMGALRQLLRYAYAHNMEVTLFISPSHAYLWEAMSMTGLWQSFEDWKRLLVIINQEEATRAGKTSVSVWDFSGYNTFTTEEVPADGSGRQMQWYWEPSHFRPALGKRMLNRIFDDTNLLDSNFGVELTAENIESSLKNIRLGQARYRSRHAAEIKVMKTLGITPTSCLGSRQ